MVGDRFTVMMAPYEVVCLRRILIQNLINQLNYWLDDWCQISGGVSISTTLVVEYIQLVLLILILGVKLPYCETIYFCLMAIS
jgi:hypothetical protein